MRVYRCVSKICLFLFMTLFFCMCASRLDTLSSYDALQAQMQAQAQQEYLRQERQREKALQQDMEATHQQLMGVTKRPQEPIDTIMDKVWLLVEIQIGYGNIMLNREEMAKNNMNSAYIIMFNEEGVSGQAAPNKYFAQYASRDGKTIALMPIVGTLMASETSIGGLMENEYYWYLQRLTRWDVNGTTLILYTSPRPGEEIMMRYILSN